MRSRVELGFKYPCVKARTLILLYIIANSCQSYNARRQVGGYYD